MLSRSISRRSLGGLAIGGLLLASSAARARSTARLTARDVVARIREHVGVPWINPTSDTFKFGNPQLPVRGITTTFMCTFELLKRSLAAGNNFVITHETPFWAEAVKSAGIKAQ